MSLVAQIAPACAWVAGQAQHVKIYHEKIPAYAEMILSRYPLVTAMDSQVHHVTADREETAAYILALDSINFGSGYFHIARECGIDLEYAVIAGGLKESFEQGMLKTPDQWAQVTAEQMSKIFSIPQGAHPKLDELLDFFAKHLRQTGKKILSDYQGRVLNMLDHAAGSAAALADTAAAWDGFHDVHTYKGRDIPLLKRAQILAADLHLALSVFNDMDKLTIFADNMVPHVLRCDGILEYAPDLAAKIDSGTPLLSGSEEEIEIRASAIHAVELMKQGREVTAVNLDHLLWHRGYEPEIYQRLSHRVLTVDY